MKHRIKQLVSKVPILPLLKGMGGHRPVMYAAYQASRQHATPHICNAPFNNMYFNSLGDVSMCWLTFDRPDRYSASRGIRDIWFGKHFEEMRQRIRERNLKERCGTCLKYLEQGNFTNMLARAYDNEYALGEYPRVMELELSNTCNLECTMCTGLLSSSIRKNREGLPPLESPYGDRFVDELREFIPHLRELRFNGGEPFLIPIYYKIWDAVFELNPGIKMVIATNGTVLNNRVRSYLDRGNFHLNISIDALEPGNYRSIRVNGNPVRLMENFIYFRDYCRSNKRTLCVMINPMRSNWHEMPEFVNFCNHHGVHLWFNTIVRPYEQAIWTLGKKRIEHIYKELSRAHIDANPGIDKALYEYNVGTYRNLVHNQVRTWAEEASEEGIAVENASPATLESHQTRFRNGLRAYLISKDTSDGQDLRERERAILDRVVETVLLYGTEEHRKKELYDAINSAPMEAVVDFFESHTAEEAVGHAAGLLRGQGDG